MSGLAFVAAGTAVLLAGKARVRVAGVLTTPRFRSPAPNARLGGRRRFDAARAADERRAVLLEAVGQMCVELEAGATPEQVSRSAAERCAPFPDLVEAWRASAAAGAAGADLGAPLLAHADLGAVGHAWRVAAATGAAPARVLTRVAHDLEAAQRQSRLLATALAGPRASAVLLATLPALGLGLGVLLGAHPFAVLAGTAAGRVAGGAGLALDVGGLLWARRIVATARPP
jgi:tight adherence protein B